MILKLTVFLMVVCLMTVSCQKDDNVTDIIEPQNQLRKPPSYTANIFNGNSIINANPNLKSKLQRFNDKTALRTMQSSEHHFSIDTTRVQKIQTSSYISYTFAVVRPYPVDDVLENYVITHFNNDTYRQYFISYPIINNNGDISYDMSNAQISILNDESLVYYRDANCVSVMVFEEPVCVDFKCKENNHTILDGEKCAYWGKTGMATRECTEGGWIDPGCSAGGNVGDDNPGGNTDPGGNDNGGTGTNGPGDTNEEEPEEEIVIPMIPTLIQQIENCINRPTTIGAPDSTTITPGLIASLNLSPAQIRALNVYLRVQNQCSEEAQAFFLAFIEAGPDAEVDYVNKIIKDPSFIGTKADCVLNALISSNNNLFRTTSQAFTNQNSKFKIKFTTYNNSSDPADARTALPDINGIIEIRFNLANMNTTSMSIATTILHETIHAELHRIYLSNNQGPNPLPQNQYNWYVSLWQYYNNGNQNYVASTAEHYYMATYLINNIASGLREFDENTHSLNNYKRFAWTGLETYGITAQLITNSELSNLANLSAIVNSDNHENPCD